MCVCDCVSVLCQAFSFPMRGNGGLDTEKMCMNFGRAGVGVVRVIFQY